MGNGWYLFDYENDNREPTYRRTTFTWEFPFRIINQINIFIDGVNNSEYLWIRKTTLTWPSICYELLLFSISDGIQHTFSFDPNLPAPPIYKEPANEGMLCHL